MPSSEAMESLRLPPLRFSDHKWPGELNCVLPPITPPSRPSPTNNTPWQRSPAVSSALPSPATISPGTDINNFSRPLNPEDAKFSPITHTPPSSIRPLPPPSVLPAASALPPHSNPSPQYSAALPVYPGHGVPYSYRHSGQPQTQHPSIPETFPAAYQGYGPSAVSPIVPWRQGRNLPGPSEIAGHIQRSDLGRVEIPQRPIQLQLPPRGHPHDQIVGASGEPVNAFQVTGGYYSNGAPIQRLGPADQQSLVPTVGGMAGAGPSQQQVPQQRVVNIKSPLKKTISTPRGVRDVYACPYPNCTRVSTEQSNMKAHMRMHTGEKPYVCRNPGCMKAFRWKSSLTYHEKALHVKSRPFKCLPCRRSFVERRKLRMHFDLCPVNQRHREQSGQDGDGCIP